MKEKRNDTITVKNSGYIRLPRIPDGIDGTISVAESLTHVPFKIKRVYYIYDLNNPDAVRGKHAHKELEQVLFCISGSCSIGLDDGTHRREILLDDPSEGVYLGVELWHTMHNFSKNCILLVLASDAYKESDYIRNYDDFLEYIKKHDDAGK
jgi:dTDP-4-dehydrorhamnose 3,5-epimerase-like enzyme